MIRELKLAYDKLCLFKAIVKENIKTVESLKEEVQDMKHENIKTVESLKEEVMKQDKLLSLTAEKKKTK